jgi:hypothetical protein
MNNQPIIKKHYESKILRRDSEYQSQRLMHSIVVVGESSKVTFFMLLPPQAPGERKLGR